MEQFLDSLEGCEEPRKGEQRNSADSTEWYDMTREDEKRAALAISLAGKIVAKELRPEDHATLIRNDLAKFSETTPSDN